MTAPERPPALPPWTSGYAFGRAASRPDKSAAGVPEPHLLRQAAQQLTGNARLLLSCVGWYACSSVTGTVNKAILRAFPQPMTVTLVSFWMTVMVGLVLGLVLEGLDRARHLADFVLAVQAGQHDADVSNDGPGCSISQAATSVLSEQVIGQSVADALATVTAFTEMVSSRGTVEGDEDVLGDGVAFAGVAKYPARVKCALLGWMAFKDALAQACVGTEESRQGPQGREEHG